MLMQSRTIIYNTKHGNDVDNDNNSNDYKTNKNR